MSVFISSFPSFQSIRSSTKKHYPSSARPGPPDSPREHARLRRTSPVHVTSVGSAGIKLADGIVLTGPVVFLEGESTVVGRPCPGEGERGKKFVGRMDEGALGGV